MNNKEISKNLNTDTVLRLLFFKGSLKIIPLIAQLQRPACPASVFRHEVPKINRSLKLLDEKLAKKSKIYCGSFENSL